jgi:hypothetical protein
MYAYVLQLWDVGCIYVYGRVIRSKENAKKKIMDFSYIILNKFIVLIISYIILCDITLIFREPYIAVIINTCSEYLLKIRLILMG